MGLCHVIFKSAKSKKPLIVPIQQKYCLFRGITRIAEEISFPNAFPATI